MACMPLPRLPYFSKLCHINSTIWGIIKHEIHLLIFSTTASETFLTLRPLQRVTVSMSERRCEVPAVIRNFH